MKQKISNQLLGLDSTIRIRKCERHVDYDEVFIEITSLHPECPSCGAIDCTVHDYRRQLFRHISCGQQPIVLNVNRRRYLCQVCERTFQEPLDFICNDIRITKALEFAIRCALMQTISISQIAQQLSVSEAIVMSILNSVSFDHPYLPYCLCIDEFKADTSCGKFHVSIVDGDRSVITDILMSRLQVDLFAYFSSFPLEERRKVKYFCCDMYSSYVTTAKHYLPNVIICIDKFHVVRTVTDAFNSIRIRICRTDPDSTYSKCLKRNWKLLLKRRNTLNENGHLQLNKLLTLPELIAAYEFLQRFYVLCDTESYADIRIMLTTWILDARNCGIPELLSCANTLRHWRGYILNSFKYHHSNAPSEGMNNRIKVLKRVSYGFHSFETLRRRCLLCFGPMRPADQRFLLPDPNKR